MNALLIFTALFIYANLLKIVVHCSEWFSEEAMPLGLEMFCPKLSIIKKTGSL